MKKKPVTINLIEHFFSTYKWDHFLSYFISLNSGSLSFITISVSILKIFYKKKLENLLIYHLPFGIEEVNVEFVLK